MIQFLPEKLIHLYRSIFFVERRVLEIFQVKGSLKQTTDANNRNLSLHRANSICIDRWHHYRFICFNLNPLVPGAGALDCILSPVVRLAVF